MNFDFNTLLKAALVFMLFSLAAIDRQAQAQQMIVDDTDITTARSVQLEAWYGEVETWIQTGVGLNHVWEFTPGIILDSNNDFAISNYVGEFKFIPGDLDFEGWSYGWVLGMIFDDRMGVDEFYTYLPYTFSVLDGSTLLHANVGLGGDRVDGEWDYAAIYGVRADFDIVDRITLLTEVYTTNIEPPNFQGGLRLHLVPDRLEMDITYGEGFDTNLSNPGINRGLNIGISLTPGALW